MKKLYITPITEIVKIENEQLLSASGVMDLNDDTQFNGPANAPRREFSSMWDGEESFD